MRKVNFRRMERKWQEKWEKSGIFKAREGGKKPYYVLEMYPYPSSSGLHMGHIRNYAMGDCIARYKRMHGFNVLYPMGYDAFGLPAENAAIKHKTHPKKYTEEAIEGIKRNQKALGLSYDWTREIATCYPEYYKWNQWFFLKMFQKGLAYKKKAPVNWCLKCETVLANEQVDDGKCWRCGSEVVIKDLEQWFLDITKYGDRLLKGLGKIFWPENVKKMQENWIGKSHGIDVTFKVKGRDFVLETFTTTVDTIYGVTFIVISPEHPLLDKLVTPENRESVNNYIRETRKKSDLERTENKVKTGVFTGSYAINPLDGSESPIWVADYVLMSYGTGVVMGVPAHDQRDLDFAEMFNFKIIQVLESNGMGFVYDDVDKFNVKGKLVNSGRFNSMPILEARERISDELEKIKMGKRTIKFKLRDWLISRQRYWGTPIPIVYCDKCGIVPVPEKDLPVRLPTDVKFTGHGNPLAKSEKFIGTRCPKCRGKGRRETDTMDTFVDSSWYFLRFCSPNEKKSAFDRSAVKYWMPVDQYIGGVEHAVMHLMYARFFTMVLHDMGMLDFDEPFQRLFNQGIVYKDGHKMSKSFGNVVTQEEISKTYGIDTARLFLLFVASPESQLEWSDKGVQGAYRFLNRAFKLVDMNRDRISSGRYRAEGVHDRILMTKLSLSIKTISEQIEGFQFNLAVSNIMELVGYLGRYAKGGKVNAKLFGDAVRVMIQLLSPFAPHAAEEMWEKVGGKGLVSASRWPAARKPDNHAVAIEGLISQLDSDIEHVLRLVKKKPRMMELIVSPEWKYDLFAALRKEIKGTRDAGKILKSLMSEAKFRSHGKDISRMVPGIIRNPDRIPDVMLTQKQEASVIEEIIPSLEKEHGCRVSVRIAEKSSSRKAGQAAPGKPGIEVG